MVSFTTPYAHATNSIFAAASQVTIQLIECTHMHTYAHQHVSSSLRTHFRAGLSFFRRSIGCGGGGGTSSNKANIVWTHPQSGSRQAQKRTLPAVSARSLCFSNLYPCVWVHRALEQIFARVQLFAVRRTTHDKCGTQCALCWGFFVCSVVLWSRMEGDCPNGEGFGWCKKSAINMYCLKATSTYTDCMRTGSVFVQRLTRRLCCVPTWQETANSDQKRNACVRWKSDLLANAKRKIHWERSLCQMKDDVNEWKSLCVGL